MASIVGDFRFRELRQINMLSKVRAKTVTGTTTPIATLSLFSRPTEAVLGEDTLCGRDVSEARSSDDEDDDEDDDVGTVVNDGNPTESAAVIGSQKSVKAGVGGGGIGEGVHPVSPREETNDVNASRPSTVSLILGGLETENGCTTVCDGKAVTQIPLVENVEVI